MIKNHTKKNKKKNKIIIFVISSFCLLSLCGLIGINKFSFNKEKTTTNDGVVINSIHNSGISIKMLNSTTDQNGNPIQTLSYSVEPKDATDKTISIITQFKQTKSNCESYVKVTNDQKNFTISIHCLSAFNEQIDIILISNDNPNATATIVLDYEKKLLDAAELFIGNGKLSHSIYDYMTNLTGDENTNTYGVIARYSKYTIDKSYSAIVTDCNFIPDTKNEPIILPDGWKEGEVFNAIANQFNKSIIDNKRTPTIKEIMDCSQYLNSTILFDWAENNISLHFGIQYKIQINELIDTSYSIQSSSNYIFNFGDYSDEDLNTIYSSVNSITSEETSIIF